MPTNPDPLRVSEIVSRAVEICDPDDEDPVLGDFQRALEDDDRPVTAVQNLEEHLAMVLDGMGPDAQGPSLDMAVATVLYLAHRRDEYDGDPGEVLRLTARAEWKGDPPHVIVDWLAQRGVAL
jgi:hypothetical protein